MQFPCNSHESDPHISAARTHPLVNLLISLLCDQFDRIFVTPLFNFSLGRSLKGPILGKALYLQWVPKELPGLSNCILTKDTHCSFHLSSLETLMDSRLRNTLFIYEICSPSPPNKSHPLFIPPFLVFSFKKGHI